MKVKVKDEYDGLHMDISTTTQDATPVWLGWTGDLAAADRWLASHGYVRDDNWTTIQVGHYEAEIHKEG